MKKRSVFVCSRCGYRAHHRMKCPSCGFHLEKECLKCYNAKGNCVCRYHGIALKAGRAGKSVAAAAKKKKSTGKKKKR